MFLDLFVYELSIKRNKKQRNYQQKTQKTNKQMQSVRVSRSNSIRGNSATSNRHRTKQIPRVQIFLDTHLSKAINKIKEQSLSNKQQYHKRYSTFDEQDTREQSFKPKTSIMIDKKTTPRTLNLSLVDNKEITLMPNDVVLKYIKQVYEKYGIKNPLEGYLDFNIKQGSNDTFEKNLFFSGIQEKEQKQKPNLYTVKTQKKQRKTSQIQSKILELKNNFKNVETENARYEQQNTIKKINALIEEESSEQNSSTNNAVDFVKQSEGNITYIENLIPLIDSRVRRGHKFENCTAGNQAANQNLSPQKSIRQTDKLNCSEMNIVDISSPQVMKPKKKLFVKTRVMSTNYNSIQASTHETPQSQRVRFKDFSSCQSHQVIYGSARQQEMAKVNQSSGSIIISNLNEKSSKFIESDYEITQIYRYCLGCEEPILNCNIVFHESNCEELKRTYDLPLDEVLDIVMKKIQLIRKEILESQLFNLKPKDVEEIKSNVSIALQQSDNEKNNSKQKGKDNFKKVDKFFSKKLLSGCQLIKKLGWFMKLKQNIEENLKFEQSSRQRIEVSQISKFETK